MNNIDSDRNMNTSSEGSKLSFAASLRRLESTARFLRQIDEVKDEQGKAEGGHGPATNATAAKVSDEKLSFDAKCVRSFVNISFDTAQRIVNNARHGNITDAGVMMAIADELTNKGKRKEDIEDGISASVPFPLVPDKPLVVVTLGIYHVKNSKVRGEIEVGFSAVIRVVWKGSNDRIKILLFNCLPSQMKTVFSMMVHGIVKILTQKNQSNTTVMQEKGAHLDLSKSTVLFITNCSRWLIQFCSEIFRSKNINMSIFIHQIKPSPYPTHKNSFDYQVAQLFAAISSWGGNMKGNLKKMYTGAVDWIIDKNPLTYQQMVYAGEEKSYSCKYQMCIKQLKDRLGIDIGAPVPRHDIVEARWNLTVSRIFGNTREIREAEHRIMQMGRILPVPVVNRRKWKRKRANNRKKGEASLRNRQAERGMKRSAKESTPDPLYTNVIGNTDIDRTQEDREIAFASSSVKTEIKEEENRTFGIYKVTAIAQLGTNENASESGQVDSNIMSKGGSHVKQEMCDDFYYSAFSEARCAKRARTITSGIMRENVATITKKYDAKKMPKGDDNVKNRGTNENDENDVPVRNGDIWV